MKQCPYCGKQIGDNALFCSKCGKKLPEVKYCSHCGATVNGTDLFCSSCGAKLDKAKTGNDVKVVTEVRNQRPFIHNQPKPYPLSPTPYNSTRKNSTKNIAIWIIIPLVILALIGGGVYFYLNCSSNEQEAKVEIVADGIRTLNGAIGEYPITMELHIEKPNVDGSLYYNKYDPSNKLFVSGSLNNNEIELIEHNKVGMETGRYKGNYSNRVFQGEYVNYKGETYTFYLSETEGVIESSGERQPDNNLTPVHLGVLYGNIGETYVTFEINGITGSYQVWNENTERTLRLASWKPNTGECVINAYLENGISACSRGQLVELMITRHITLESSQV